MSSTKIPVEFVTFRHFVDAEPPAILDMIVPQLNSGFLTNTLMNTHQLEGRTVRMKDHINLLVTAELPGRKFLGFLASEVEPEAKLARLHVVYVLRGYRRSGVSHLLMDEFEQLLRRLDCNKILTLPVTTLSLGFFKKRASQPASADFAYQIHILPADELLRGDREIAND